MNPHPYLRAYLAGICVTTLILPVILTAFIVIRLVLMLPVPIERGLIFPMALVPAVWGLWNMLWLASHERTHLAVGVHGGCCPFCCCLSGPPSPIAMAFSRWTLRASHGSTRAQSRTPSLRLCSAVVSLLITWSGSTSSAF